MACLRLNGPNPSSKVPYSISNCMKNSTLIISLLAAISGWSSPIYLDLDSSSSNYVSNVGGSDNTIKYTAGGLSIEATAWSRLNFGPAFSQSKLIRYSGGLGVEADAFRNSSGTWVYDTGTPQHSIDNSQSYDYVFLSFSSSIVLDKVNIGWVSGDSDFQLWIGTNILAPSGFGTFPFTESNTVTNGNIRNADVNAGGFVGNSILIAASTISPYNTGKDYFKLKGLTFDVPPSVPDSGSTFMLLGAGLLLAAILRRK